MFFSPPSLSPSTPSSSSSSNLAVEIAAAVLLKEDSPKGERGERSSSYSNESVEYKEYTESRRGHDNDHSPDHSDPFRDPRDPSEFSPSEFSDNMQSKDKLNNSSNMNNTKNTIIEPNITVGYATDVEGNYEYWTKYIEISKILNRLPSGELELRTDCHFVYGGDVVDRGPGDLRVLSDLLAIKRKYPEKVHFIMGNRYLLNFVITS